jgi:hypothetical protein
MFSRKIHLSVQLASIHTVEHFSGPRKTELRRFRSTPRVLLCIMHGAAQGYSHFATVCNHSTFIARLWLAAVMKMTAPICVPSIDEAMPRPRFVQGLLQHTHRPLSSNDRGGHGCMVCSNVAVLQTCGRSFSLSLVLKINPR